MATLEINVPIEFVEAGIQGAYGLDYGIEVLDVMLDDLSGDLVFLVHVDDDEFPEIALTCEPEQDYGSDTWTVTTTADFIEGVL